MLSSGRLAQDYIFRFPVKSQKQLNGLVVYNVLKADMQTVFTIFRSCHILGLSLNHTYNTQRETASTDSLFIKRIFSPDILKLQLSPANIAIQLQVLPPNCLYSKLAERSSKRVATVAASQHC